MEIDFQTKKPSKQRLASVFHKEQKCEQPQAFSFCPLGAQVYTQKPISECELLDFKATVPDKDGTECEVACTGLVVHCQQDEDDPLRYRVWIKFLDLPDATGSRLEGLCKAGGYLCPFCVNY